MATKAYRIISSAALDMGEYPGETPEAALDAMARDAGYRDHAHACEVTGEHPLNWTVRERDTSIRLLTTIKPAGTI